MEIINITEKDGQTIIKTNESGLGSLIVNDRKYKHTDGVFFVDGKIQSDIFSKYPGQTQEVLKEYKKPAGKIDGSSFFNTKPAEKKLIINQKSIEEKKIDMISNGLLGNKQQINSNTNQIISAFKKIKSNSAFLLSLKSEFDDKIDGVVLSDSETKKQLLEYQKNTENNINYIQEKNNKEYNNISEKISSLNKKTDSNKLDIENKIKYEILDSEKKMSDNFFENISKEKKEISENIKSLETEIDNKINTNTENININKDNITSNKLGIETNKLNISKNESKINKIKGGQGIIYNEGEIKADIDKNTVIFKDDKIAVNLDKFYTKEEVRKNIEANMGSTTVSGGGVVRLSKLKDVEIEGPVDGQTLSYNETTKKRENVDDTNLKVKGNITIASDFPTTTEIKEGRVYKILADVTDNDPAKTNTGDSFLLGDIIYRNGSGWLDITGLEVWIDDGTNVSPFNPRDVNIASGQVYKIDGIQLSTGDIPESTDNNYVSDAELVVLQNTSGVNTGDQDASTLPVDTTNFDNILSPIDDTVQKALDTLDNAEFEYIDFKQSPAVASQKARVKWNEVRRCLDIDEGDGSVNQVGRELRIYVLNDTGFDIPNGKAVYPTGATDGIPTIGLAVSSSFETISVDYGMTTETILDGGYGIVVWFGRANNIDTSAFTLNDIAWIDPTIPGAITRDRPAFPYYAIQLGIVMKIGATDGVVFVTSKSSVENTFNNFWNGTIRESFKFVVTSDGATVTGSLSPKNGHPNLTMLFSDGFNTLETTPPKTIVLIPGTDALPQRNFVYITKTNQYLEVSTAGFPDSEEHIKVADLVVRSALTTQTDGVLKNQNFNDHIQDTITNQGHLSHLGERIRSIGAAWLSGTEGVCTVDAGATPNNVYISVTSGYVYQLHKQVFEALDMQTGDDMHVVNNFTTPFKTITNLNSETIDSEGVSLKNSSFSFVLWGIINQTGTQSHIMLNLPRGHYPKNSPELAESDAYNYSNYTIPAEYKGVGFLIARFNFSLDTLGNVWTLYSTQDLRDIATYGGGGGGSGVSSFTALTDTPNSYIGKTTNFVQVNALETGLEYVAQTSINHDTLTNYVANQHIDWTNTTSNLLTTGTGTFGIALVDIIKAKATTGIIVKNSADVTIADFGVTGNNPSEFYGDGRFNNNLTITGNLIVNGTTTTLDTETLQVEDNIIDVNHGEIGGGVTKGSAGMKVDRGTLTDYLFVFDEVRDGFAIGQGADETAPTIAGLQLVATREDSPISNGFAYFNNSLSRFDTKLLQVSDISGLVSSQWTTTGSNIYYNTGNVGIGTTSPVVSPSPLTPADTVLMIGDNTGRAELRLAGPNAVDMSSKIVFDNSSVGDGMSIFFTSNTTPYGPDGLIFYDENTGKVVMKINRDNGKVGIGTASPSEHSDLTLAESGVLCFKESTTPTSNVDYGKIYTKADNILYFQDGSGVEKQLVDTKSTQTIESSKTFIGSQSIIDGNLTLQLGADIGGNVLTDNLAKISRIVTKHYTNAEQPVANIVCQSDATNNIVAIGGATSLANAATDVRFYAASNTTTLLGTLIQDIQIDRVRIYKDLVLDGVLSIKETTTPTATTGYGAVYTKTDNQLYFQDGAGSEKFLVNSTDSQTISGTKTFTGTVTAPNVIYGSNLRGTTTWGTGVNNIIKSGFYFVSGDLSNLPVATNGYVLHIQYDSSNDFAYQEYYRLATFNRYFRQKVSGIWGAWDLVINKTDVQTISGKKTFTDTIDSSYGGISLLLGADNGATTRTNATIKYSRISSSHYTNAEEPMALFFGTANATQNICGIGGGSSSLNTATDIRFYTSTNNTTTIGTLRMSISKDGNVNIGGGNPSEYADLTLGSSGVLCLREGSTPTADTNYGKVYTKTDNQLYFQDGDGIEKFLVNSTDSQTITGVKTFQGTSSYNLVIETTASTTSPQILLRGNISGSDNPIARIAAYNQTDSMGYIYFNRTDADNSSSISFGTQNAGTVGVGMELKKDGSLYVKSNLSVGSDTFSGYTGSLYVFRNSIRAGMSLINTATSGTDNETTMRLYNYDGSTTSVCGSLSVYDVNHASKANDIALVTSRSNGDILMMPNGTVKVTVSTATTTISNNLVASSSATISPASASSTLTLGRISGNPSIKANSDAAGYLFIESSGAGTGVVGINFYNTDSIWLANGGGSVTVGTNASFTNSDLTLANRGVLGLKETTTPTADTGYGKVYTKSDNILYFQDGDGTEKKATSKGSAIYSRTFASGTINSGSIVFEFANTETFNDSTISKVSNSKVTLKTGHKYKVTVSINASGNYTSGYVDYKIYNATSASYVGTTGTILRASAGNSASSSTAIAFFNATSNIDIEFHHAGGDEITSYYSSMVIEEM